MLLSTVVNVICPLFFSILVMMLAPTFAYPVQGKVFIDNRIKLERHKKSSFFTLSLVGDNSNDKPENYQQFSLNLLNLSHLPSLSNALIDFPVKIIIHPDDDCISVQKHSEYLKEARSNPAFYIKFYTVIKKERQNYLYDILIYLHLIEPQVYFINKRPHFHWALAFYCPRFVNEFINRISWLKEKSPYKEETTVSLSPMTSYEHIQLARALMRSGIDTKHPCTIDKAPIKSMTETQHILRHPGQAIFWVDDKFKH